MKKSFWFPALLLIVIVIEGWIIFTFVMDSAKGNTNSEGIINNLSIEAGNFDNIKIYIPVETVMQEPELPNGCEITSLTAILNYYGYDVTKTYMSDHFLPKMSFQKIDGKLYGPNPYKAYAGEPRDKTGYFAYAPPIVQAANNYFRSIGIDHHAVDISGSSSGVIMELLNKGNPIVIWVTLDLSQPIINDSWYFYDSVEYFQAPKNLHAVVLNGYSNGLVNAMDPLQGQVSYDAGAFFQSYKELGSHALMIKE